MTDLNFKLILQGVWNDTSGMKWVNVMISCEFP